jgi:hypothetical protein
VLENKKPRSDAREKRTSLCGFLSSFHLLLKTRVVVIERLKLNA